MGTFYETPLNELFHEYDPVKAREYYLRTRELKGRKPAAAKPVGKGRDAAARAQAAKQKLAAERKAKRQKLQAKLKELETRLDQLNRAIKQAKIAAMRRAGNVSEDTLNRMITQELKSPGSSKGMKDSKEKKGEKAEGDEKPQKKTAAQKREAAEYAKEKYEEENPKTGNEALQEKVDKTAERIEKLQKRVEAIGRIGA